MLEELNNETLDIDIDDLFKDPEESSPTEQEEKPTSNNEDMTKAVSDRINTVKKNTVSETEARIAKELGFDSYEDLRKANEKKLLKDAGYDENDEKLGEIVNKLVEARLNNDPRIKKVEAYEEDEKTKFVKSQL
jgi:DNA-binding MurR/RpiR family transcriptional regulator